MKKKLLNMALALTVLCTSFYSFSSHALAANDEPFETSWNVVYDGSSLVSSYENDKVKKTISGLMPGDTIEYKVNYKNTSKKLADFYMSSDVLASLESGENSNAANGAYTYTISYDAGKGVQYIYDSETLGGDKYSESAPEGLMQAAATNGNYFHIGQLEAGKDGTVTVRVVLDGNSQDNSYMTTLAMLGIKFGVEDVAINNREIVYTTDGGQQIVHLRNALVALSGPQTGDSMLPLLLCLLALILGIALVVVYFKLTKAEAKEVE